MFDAHNHADTAALTWGVRLAALHADHAWRSPMRIKWANKALIALCLTLAITLVLMVYA
jgi:hypothetical protein